MAVKQNIKNKKFVNFLEKLASWEVIILSANPGNPILARDTLLGSGLKNFIILATCFMIWFLKSNKKFKVSSFSLMCFITLWLFMTSFFRNSPFNVLIGLSATPLIMYMLISVSDFKRLRELLLNALTKLSAATLIIYFAIYRSLGIGITNINRNGTVQIFYIFRDWWGRPASIYQEPGCFQIITISILILFIDELVKLNFTNVKYYIKKFGIVILTLLAAQSSMGYICFTILVMLIFIYNKSAKHNILVYAIILVMGIIPIFLLWQSDTIQEKIDPTNLLIRSSLSERIADSNMLYEMSFISPLTGLGKSSPYYYGYARFYGGFLHGDGVNGSLNMIVCHGWPFFFIIIVCMLVALGRMKQDIPSILVLLVLLLSYSDEAYYLHYLMYLYIFTFNSYDGRENLS